MSSSTSVSTSTTAFSPPSSSSAIRQTDKTASAVAAAATASLSPPASTTSASLKDAEPLGNSADELYRQARQFLKDGKPHEARDIFLKLLTGYGKDESNLLNCADCTIGIAYTYKKGDPARNNHALAAKEILDAVFDKMCEDDVPEAINDEATISGFQRIRLLYGSFVGLVPEEKTDFHADIKAKIEHCKRRTPELTYFYMELARGQGRLVRGNSDRAYAIIHEAMSSINGVDNDDNPEFLVARAIGNLQLAFATEKEARDDHATQAQSLASAAYRMKDRLYANDKAKRQFLKSFILLYDGFSRFFLTDSPLRSHFLKTLQECQKELDSLPPAEEPVASKIPEDSKIDSNPAGDYWKTARIALAFTIAAAVIVGAAFLGRRFITRLN
jgi:hypothetical protein